MKKFAFRLESVLRLRGMQLLAEKEKLAHLLGEVNKLEQSLATLTHEKTAAVNFVQTEPSIGSTELRALSAFLLAFDARCAAIRDAIQRASAQAAAQRQRVVEADRNERLLIEMKKKRLAEWRHEADHEVEVLAEESWNAVHGSRG